MEKEHDLEKLKKEYEKIQNKYGLPSFKELNQDFGIEKIAVDETEILIREVRKFVGDKMLSYMRFIENLLNPVNVPMFVFSIVKSLDQEDKKKLSETYSELTKNEIKLIELDLEFNEDKEADFVKDSYKLWQNTKKDMVKILEKVDSNQEKKSESNGKGYYG